MNYISFFEKITPLKGLLLLFVVSLFGTLPAYGQIVPEKIEVSGIVTSLVDGEPIDEVWIRVKGGDADTISRFGGKYALHVQRGDTLVFSYRMGYLDQEIHIDTQKVINVVLMKDPDIEDVILLGGPYPTKNTIQGLLRAETWIEQREGSKKKQKKQLLSFTKDTIQYRTAGKSRYTAFPYYLSEEPATHFDFNKVDKRENGEFIIKHAGGKKARCYKLIEFSENHLILESHTKKGKSIRTYKSVYDQYLLPDTLYFIGTPVIDNYDEDREGLFRSNRIRLKNNPLYKYPPIHITLRSKVKNIWIPFTHYNYNPVELAKTRPVEPLDEMVILKKTVEFLQTIDLIDLDALCPAIMSSEYAAESFVPCYYIIKIRSRELWDKHKKKDHFLYRPQRYNAHNGNLDSG